MSNYEVYSDGKTAYHLFVIDKCPHNVQMKYDWKKFYSGSKKECQLFIKNERNKEQLNKAKEIIKLLLGDLRNRSYEPVKDLERAEQFLKENK